jgi:uncharacterized protein (DUF1684 family)
MLLFLTMAACRSTNTPMAESKTGSDYAAEIQQWRERRVASLTSEDGWLSLAGLFWLEEGESTFGSAKSNDLVFPAPAPGSIGSLVRSGEEVRIQVMPGIDVLHDGKPVSEMVLKNDADGDPSILTHGSLSWYIIQREEGRLAVRLKDSQHPNLASFHGIDSYPIDEAWRVEAHVALNDAPKTLSIPTIYGTVLKEPSPGALVFEVGGETYRLDYLPEGNDAFFVIFGDTTNKDATYQAGRYVYVDPPGADGKTFIDFNKAYNPPCVFTAFATCPLPPAQNRLQVGVTAGEKRYAGEKSNSSLSSVFK